ncbi:MAG: isopeptide-forming domain-containing fimbrial protein, partial [Pseudomonadota bacterium]
MRVTSSLRRLAAALALVLLPIAVLGGEVHAQDQGTGDPATTPSDAVIRTITNTAQAEWIVDGNPANTLSNTVTFDVTAPPPAIRAFRPTAEGPTELNFREPVCSALGRSGQATATVPGVVNDQVVQPLNVMVEQTSILRAGQVLIFEVEALTANTDPDAIDELEIVITTSTGDREIETIFETGPNTGVFVGQMDTARMPPPPVQFDCRLSLLDGASITIEAMTPQTSQVLARTEVEVLADPFGVVFDSETGELVNGARVSLVDAITGQPATVFAEDGVTPWPSSVISGEPITDGAGRITQMGPGEFWFPSTLPGTYRLAVEPPEPFTAPSVVQPEDIARITRPDGSAFVVGEGSYGDAFELTTSVPGQIDIPLDQPGLDLGITKTASRAQVVPGDVVFYAITVSNPDSGRAKRDVVVTDTPSRSLRLRPDTIRVNGEEASESVTIAPDGSSLQIDLGTLEGGASVRVTYAMSVRPDAASGRAINLAVVTDLLGRTARAQVPVDIQRETIADRMT